MMGFSMLLAFAVAHLRQHARRPRAVAADPPPIRIINLPFGLKDGLSERGAFSATYQYYQTLPCPLRAWARIAYASLPSRDSERYGPAMIACCAGKRRAVVSSPRRSRAKRNRAKRQMRDGESRSYQHRPE
jgi:hypothetical protein